MMSCGLPTICSLRCHYLVQTNGYHCLIYSWTTISLIQSCNVFRQMHKSQLCSTKQLGSGWCRHFFAFSPSFVNLYFSVFSPCDSCPGSILILFNVLSSFLHRVLVARYCITIAAPTVDGWHNKKAYSESMHMFCVCTHRMYTYATSKPLP